jgi:hypothetical protein
MQEVMAELQALGALDPAAQGELMADLSRTDPAWWPMVVQQFRAAVAYRRRAEDRGPRAADPGRSSPVRPVSATMQPERIGEPGAEPPSGQAHPLPRVSRPGGEPLGRVGRLPVTEDVALPPSKAPPGNYPATLHPQPGPHLANRPTDVRQARARNVRGSPDPVLPRTWHGQETGHNVSDAPSGSGDWQAHVGGAIRALESQLQGAPAAPAEVAQHAQLRMLYLMAGRRDDAVQPIASIAAADQEFWSKQVYGLATWLDTEGTADAARRAAKTKQILEEAVARLGESAPLVVRNLAFCTEVQSYGCTKQFSKSEFSPDQEVLLYAEVENFTCEATPKGFHTSLRSSYQIFDSRGQRVADHQFTTTEEYCQNCRRDFFIGYHLRLPKRIYPGKHTLQLTIEDLKSHKVGQSSIELTIRHVDE